MPFALPGRVSGGYRAGGHLAPGHADGRITFEEYLAGRPRLRGPYRPEEDPS